MVTRFADEKEDGKLFLILNASRKEIDCKYMSERLPHGVHLEPKLNRALLALQGPKAASVLAELAPRSAELRFMQAAPVLISGNACHISRSGYTGEDGFEISVASHAVHELWETLLRFDEVRACGLGARDSLRLEAGLCLYGRELDETTSPIEAGLAWSIHTRRRRNGAFPGASRIQREIAHGTTRLRVGILPDGRAPARENTDILAPAGLTIGIVTSGGYSPTLKRPIAMGYVAPEHASVGGEIKLVVRGNALDARIVKLPFVPHGYHRNP
jgi:aminomethyltransferase